MANYNHYLPKKIDLKPKRHHGMQVVIFICGFLFPPLGELSFLPSLDVSCVRREWKGRVRRTRGDLRYMRKRRRRGCRGAA
jgi:hypothetical protein